MVAAYIAGALAYGWQDVTLDRTGKVRGRLPGVVDDTIFVPVKILGQVVRDEDSALGDNRKLA